MFVRRHLLAGLVTIGLAAVGCGDQESSGGGGGGGGDTTAPTIVSISIADSATDIARDTTITVVFSEAIAASSLGATTLTLEDAASAAVTTSHTYDAGTFTVTVTPGSNLANFTAHTFSVTTAVTDAAGNSLAAGDSVTFTTIDDVAPATPSTPTDAGTWSTSTTVSFDWTAADDDGSGVASYWLQVGTTSGGNDVLDMSVGNVLTYDATGTDGDTLYARVAAVDVAGTQGAFSSVSDGIGIDATAPVVTNLPEFDSDVDDATVTVSWGPATDDNSGIAGYVLEVATDSSGTNVVDTVPLGNVLTHDYDATTRNGDMLYMRVSAADLAGNAGNWSSWSTGTLVDTAMPDTPAAPSDRGAVSRSSTLDFDWTPATDSGSGVTGYVVRIATANDGSGIVSTQTLADVLTYAFSGALSDGTTYYASIAAVDAAGNQSDWSSWSDGIYVDVSAPGKPGKPTDDQIRAYFSGGDVIYTWTAAAGAVVNYRVEVGSTPGTNDVVSSATIAGTSYTLTVDPSSGDTFYVRVVAVNASDVEGVWSEVSDVLTFDKSNPTDPGTPIDEGTSTDAMVSFTWSAASDSHSGITKYIVQIANSASDTDIIHEEETTDPSYVFDGGNWGEGTVFARVSAVNGADLMGDWSGWSDGITFDGSYPRINWAWPNNEGGNGDNHGAATDITVYFSEPMDTASVEAAFSLFDTSDGDSEPMHGYAFFWDDKEQTVTVMPDTQNPAGITNIDLLIGDHDYEISVLSTATDLAGNPLADWNGDEWVTEDYSATFHVMEDTAPTLLWGAADATIFTANPVDLSDVENGDTLVLAFSEDMNGQRARIEIRSDNDEIRATLEQNWLRDASGDGTYVTYTLDRNHELSQGSLVTVSNTDQASWDYSGPVYDTPSSNQFRVMSSRTGSFNCCGEVFYSTGDGATLSWTGDAELTLEFTRDLQVGEYSMRLEDLSDVAGNGLWDEISLQIVDSSIADSQAPTLIGAIPLDGDSAAEQTLPFFITFDEPIHAGSLDNIVITGIASDSYRVFYPLEQFGSTAAIMPLGVWPAGAAIQIQVPTSVTDLAGNGLQTATTIDFTVESPTDTAGPMLAESIPAANAVTFDFWDLQMGFVDSSSGAADIIDMATVDPADILVMDESRGMPTRGWTAHSSDGGDVLRLQPQHGGQGLNSLPQDVSILSAVGDGSKATFITDGPHGMVVDMEVRVWLHDDRDSQFRLENALVTEVSTNGFSIASGAAGSSFGGGNVNYEAPRSYSVTLADNAITGGDGITDIAGNAMPATELNFTYSRGPENRWPGVNDLNNVRVSVDTTAAGRVLNVRLDLRDPDGDMVTVKITSPDIQGLDIERTIFTDNGGWFSYPENGGGGPPEDSDPIQLNPQLYDTTGPVTFVIELNDGMQTVTYRREAFIWATADLPSLGTVDGKAVDSAKPILVTTALPTFNWTMADTVNANLVQTVVADITALGDNNGPDGYYTFKILDPSETTLTLHEPLPIGLYVWAVVQMKMPAGFGEPLGSGWTLNLGGNPPPMDSFFIYGPDNADLNGDTFAHAAFGVEIGSNSSGMRDMWSNFGTIELDSDTTALASSVRHDGDIANPESIIEYYAHDATTHEFMLAAMVDGPPLPFRGMLGRNQQLFSVVPENGEKDDGEDISTTAIFVVGAHRYQNTGFLAEDLDGSWAFMQLQFETDGAGTFTNFSSMLGTADSTSDGASTGYFHNVSGVDNAGTPFTPGDNSNFSLADNGLLTVAIGDIGVGYGYVGGAPKAEIIPLSAVTDGSEFVWEVLVRQHMWNVANDETETVVAGTYDLTSVELSRDEAKGNLQGGGTMRGSVTFNGIAGAGVATYFIQSGVDSEAGSLGYGVDNARDRVVIDGTDCIASPDFATLLCMGTESADRIQLMIFTK